MADLDEAELVTRARRGEKQAWEQLLQRYERTIYRFGLRMCGNPEDAKEVLQETLLNAFRTLPQFRGDARLSTWLFQIARSFCIKERRRPAGAPERFESLDTVQASQMPSPSASQDQRLHAKEVAEVIQAALHAMAPPLREALILRDIEGLSAEDAAQVVGIDAGALKSRLHRARVSLKRSLNSVLDESPEAIACPELGHALAAYAASEIDQAACALIEAHLAQCDACTAACESLKRTVSLCRSIPGGEVPGPVRAAVRAALMKTAAFSEAS